MKKSSWRIGQTRRNLRKWNVSGQITSRQFQLCQKKRGGEHDAGDVPRSVRMDNNQLSIHKGKFKEDIFLFFRKWMYKMMLTSFKLMLISYCARCYTNVTILTVKIKRVVTLVGFISQVRREGRQTRRTAGDWTMQHWTSFAFQPWSSRGCAPSRRLVSRTLRY